MTRVIKIKPLPPLVLSAYLEQWYYNLQVLPPPPNLREGVWSDDHFCEVIKAQRKTNVQKRGRNPNLTGN